jgi:hypothetical protein
MAEPGSRRPAGDQTAAENVGRIVEEEFGGDRFIQSLRRSNQLRQELGAKGLKGFKKGGKVKRTGVYKLHKGEKVQTAAAAKKAAAKKPAARRRVTPAKRKR